MKSDEIAKKLNFSNHYIRLAEFQQNTLIHIRRHFQRVD